ncbi:TIGR04222 domain-containing membrane protein [Kitasatospora sp. NPDC049258]|uniref:TIGR04222 domain-containing membrane protein n=1 Tax=Kitasatospora sp. NPDC049258 TaxID=3155394 RepID=UPI00343B8F41
MWLILLIPACFTAVLSCLRLVRVAATFDPVAGSAVARPDQLAGVGLYETAYLAGGPTRVVDLVLVLMAGRGRLHLAHTGWTTVVDPQGRSRLERAVIGAVGGDGQCRTAQLRAALAGHATVLEIGERLAAAGLATPAEVRERTSLAVRRVRHAFLLGLALLAAALLPGSTEPGDTGAALAWFSLPLILTGGTLLMARVDVQPYTRWAAPAGEQALRSATLPQQHGGPVDEAERELLTAVAMVGPEAVTDARLRAALRH